MTIGINVSAAFKQFRTGVEECVYQLIRALGDLEESRSFDFALYSRSSGHLWNLPSNFRLETLAWPGPMWTQARLAWEMTRRAPDVLYIPAHILPTAHPRRSVVTIHGLEFERYPRTYPSMHRRYLRWSTRYAVRHAWRVTASSQSTKEDLVKLYGVNPDRITVVHLGFSPLRRLSVSAQVPYFLYLGRVELKKNIVGLLSAFDLFKVRYGTTHKLVLAGSPGYGYELIRSVMARCQFRRDIVEKGYVSEEEKARLLSGASLFLFPSLCEGFGLPVLEAQSVDCPVVASRVSSLPEVAGPGAWLVDPHSSEDICQAIHGLVSDGEKRNLLINEGRKNIQRFSWKKCAGEILKVLVE